MSDKIKVALLGLAGVGEVFAENFLVKIQEGGKPVEIVAVAERSKDSFVAMGFAQNNVPVFEDPLEVVKLGDKVDIIFDLTNDANTRKALRMKLQETNNRHTVIAPEIFARLLWQFFDEKEDLPRSGLGGY